MKQIPLTQGKFAIVDDEDFEYLNQFKWHISQGRASRHNSKSETKILMHREIAKRMGLDIKDKFIDHIDMNQINNCRNNI